MARKKITRRLKPLPTRARLRAREHKTARLLEILRQVAIRSQSEEAQAFYPVRDVADQFRVSTSLVARAYDQLEDEGLLSSVRGSKTILQGKIGIRRLNVLGFVGMPAAVSAFVALQDYRMFFIRLRRELRARGFAVVMVLFDPVDIKSGRLDKRLAKYHFDTVLWYRPDAAARNLLSRLRDKGVRLVGVNDHHLSPIHNRYEIRREPAIAEILRYWREKVGVKSVNIIRGVKAAAKEETLQQLLEEENFHFNFLNSDNTSARKFLRSLGRLQTEATIFPSWAASQFSFREPEGLMQLAERSHVAFTGGPPSIPFAQVRDVRAELVITDWQLLAERIVADLISKEAFARGETTAFEAKAHLRASLSEYSQVI